MTKSLKKLAGFILASSFVIVSLFAESAVVTYVKGKVEVSAPNGWVALKVGDKINASDTISTGFQAEARIEYNGSLMSLGSLTRITLDNLASSSTKDDVSVYLSTGAVRSKVTHTDNKRVSYSVKSPIAVASVRGTDFTVTANGTVSCNEGAVAVYANREDRKAKKSSGKAKAETTEEEESEENSEAEENNDAQESGSNTEASDGKSPGDYEAATATTPADEIDEKAPIGAIVVGKNQEVTFKTTGSVETPMVNAIKKSTKVINTVTTAAAQETVAIGGTSTVTTVIIENTVPEVITVPEPEIIQTSSIITTIVLED